MTKHTATPWRAGYAQDGGWSTGRAIVIRAERVDGQPYVCQMLGSDAEANAAFIVRAVNCHDELLAACKVSLTELHSWAESEGWLDCFEEDESVKVVTAAIAKAEGGA